MKEQSIKHFVQDRIFQARDEENPGAEMYLNQIMHALNHLRDDRIAGYDDRIYIIRRCNAKIKNQRKELRRLYKTLETCGGFPRRAKEDTQYA
jgi:hypothetical protein